MKELNRLNLSTKEFPIKVVMIGDGNFLRAYVAWIVQRLNEKADFDAGIIAVQSRPTGNIQRLADQDGLFHVLLRGVKGGKEIISRELIECVQDTVNPFADYQKYLSIAEEPQLRFLFSNTTEAGIYFDEKETLDKPQVNFPARATALLYERFKCFKGDKSKGLFLLPTELIDDNGDKLKEYVLAYAKLWGLPNEFVSWLNEYNYFYNTLVDRIVPGLPKANLEEIQEAIGFKDNLVVEAEPFYFFAIEGDNSIQAEFPCENVDLDVVFSKDLSSFRSRKIRILNGLHTTMVPIGMLRGYKTVKEVFDDPELVNFLYNTCYNEIVPSMRGIEGLEFYSQAILDRFLNPFVQHRLESIALNSFLKIQSRILPTIADTLKNTGQLPLNLISAIAATIYLHQRNSKNQFVPNDDPIIVNFLYELWGKVELKQIGLQELVEELFRAQFWTFDVNSIEGLDAAIAGKLELIVKKGIDPLITSHN